MEKGSYADHSDQGEDQTDDGREKSGRMNGFFHPFFIARAETSGDHHVDSAADADQKTREQSDDRRSGTDRSERGVAVRSEFSYDRDVRHIKQDLQQIRRNQRKAEKKNVLPEVSFYQIFSF